MLKHLLYYSVISAMVGVAVSMVLGVFFGYLAFVFMLLLVPNYKDALCYTIVIDIESKCYSGNQVR